MLSFETALRERRLADAVDGYRGDLLAGFDDDRNDAWSGWLTFERDRLRSAWRRAAQQYLAGELDATEAIDLAARLLDADPLDETALGVHVNWLVRAGQLARARQAYRDYRCAARGRLGTRPGRRIEAFQDRIDAGSAARGIPALKITARRTTAS